MYQNWLKSLGASEIMIQNVHVTKVKEDLLEQVPGLREQRDGKYVILTVDDEFGRALIQSQLIQFSEHNERSWYNHIKISKNSATMHA